MLGTKTVEKAKENPDLKGVTVCPNCPEPTPVDVKTFCFYCLKNPQRYRCADCKTENRLGNVLCSRCDSPAPLGYNSVLQHPPPTFMTELGVATNCRSCKTPAVVGRPCFWCGRYPREGQW